MKLLGIIIRGELKTPEQLKQQSTNLLSRFEKSSVCIPKHELYDMIKKDCSLSKFEFYIFLEKNYKHLRGKSPSGKFGFYISLVY